MTPVRRAVGLEDHYDSERPEIQDGARLAGVLPPNRSESGESAGSQSKRDRSVAQPAVGGYKKTAGRDSRTATRRLLLLILPASGFFVQLLHLFDPFGVGRGQYRFDGDGEVVAGNVLEKDVADIILRVVLAK